MSAGRALPDRCILSLAFPLVAGTVPGQLPTWVGVLDVAVALALLATAGGITVVAREQIDGPVRETSYRFYRALATAPLILIVAFWLLGDHIKWDVLLIGLGWRTWLLVYCFPAWLALWTHRPRERQPNAADR
jgi:hypothetical protein